MAQELILDLIRKDGALSVERFMALAVEKYYAKGTAFGRMGDFTTAPEISQVFGELIGVWCCLAWERLGRPDPFLLVELGPGRGSLMADLLRAGAQMPGFHRALKLHLVEKSPALRVLQGKALAGFSPQWLERIEDLPSDAPMLLVANEFLDALPIRQYVRGRDGWHERLVEFSEDAGLRFTIAEQPDKAAPLPPYADGKLAPGTLAECCPAAQELIGHICGRINSQRGMALFFDYGPGESAPGDSLQAVKDHAFCKVLERPGEADLTAHVDFAQLARSAQASQTLVHGPLAQGLWLQRLGIGERTAHLAATAGARQRHLLESGTRRLIDPEEMGTLFKTLALSSRDAPFPLGFEEK